jgi:hypothetical protein
LAELGIEAVARLRQVDLDLGEDATDPRARQRRGGHGCGAGWLEIVSKRKDSPYGSRRSPHWLKMKHPDAPAVKKREAEEDWGKKKWR